MKIATPTIAFWRENFSIRVSLNGSRTARRSHGEPGTGLSEPCGNGAGDLLNQEAQDRAST